VKPLTGLKGRILALFTRVEAISGLAHIIKQVALNKPSFITEVLKVKTTNSSTIYNDN
jgi:hypothetical protein